LRANDVIASIVSQVSRASLRSYVQGLQSFETRYTTTANCDAAGQFILSFFQSLGLEAGFSRLPSAAYPPGMWSPKYKGDRPGDVVIICGHYDSTSGEPTVLAPGADDNASGVAAVMEAARILAGYPFDFTVRFIAFFREEQGLYGSHYHSAVAREGSERIIGSSTLT